MPLFDASWLTALGAATPVAVPAWLAGALAAVFVVVCVLALRRSGRATGALLRYAVVILGALIAGSFLDRTIWPDHAAARRALDARGAELTARALAPGSALACLDSGAGETVELACEKAVFARPEAAAAAVAYVTARLALLHDGLDLVSRGDSAYENALAGLRRAIELDRYGIAAHVLATRDGCTPDGCPAFALLRDPSALKANLKARAFDNYVAHHAAAWTETPAPAAAPPAVPVASAPAVPAPAASAAASRFDFPSAASIPPVSIMNAEPKEAPAQAPTASAAPGKPPAPPVPPRRQQNQAAVPPAR